MHSLARLSLQHTTGERCNLALTYKVPRHSLAQAGAVPVHQLRPLPPPTSTSREAQVVQSLANRMHPQLMSKTEAEAGEVLVPDRGFKNSSNVALSLAPAQDQGTLSAKAATLSSSAEASDERKSLPARRSARRSSSHRLQVGSYGQLP